MTLMQTSRKDIRRKTMKFGSAAAWEAPSLTTRTESPMMTEGSSGRDMHPMLQTAEAEKNSIDNSQRRAKNREHGPWVSMVKTHHKRFLI